jgi:uncharacterized phage-associated protein
MKLQKLLYFTCKEYVRANGEMPFSEQFEVWQFGPVMPSVYAEFQTYGKKPIRRYCSDSVGDVYAVNEATNPKIRCALDSAWNAYKDFDAIRLSSMTHEDGTAWSIALDDKRNVISLEDIKREIANKRDRR